MQKTELKRLIDSIEFHNLSNFKKSDGNMSIGVPHYGMVGKLKEIGITIISERWRGNYDNQSEIIECFEDLLTKKYANRKT